MTVVLAIETSCDETAAAVVVDGHDVRSSVLSSQIDLHIRYGGVVPEVAGRSHVELVNTIVAEAMNTAGYSGEDIDVVAATVGPGLVGSLLVGLSAAKAFAFAWHKPFVAVNHMEGHIYASRLEDPSIAFPYVTLLVSGGHTQLIGVYGHGEYEQLGSTSDDAAGEAFDKVARYLGLGYPGGPAIEREAEHGSPVAVRFPRALVNDGLKFSFSGLKTAVVRYAKDHPEVEVADIAASFQEAVVDVLAIKTKRAAEQIGATGIAIGGGVAANSRLRERILDIGIADNRQVYLPSRSMCTDNAAMIASAGYFVYQQKGASDLASPANPSLPFP